MDKYYCPYCNPKYQYIEKGKNGKLICGVCGDQLIKKKFLNIRKFCALIAVLVIILPYLSLYFSSRRYDNQKREKYRLYVLNAIHFKLNFVSSSAKRFI